MFAIGYLNHVFSAATTVAASNAQTGWPASNLKNPRLSQAWKGAVADFTEWIEADLITAKAVGVVALIGTNFQDDFQRRIRVDASPIGAPFTHDSGLALAFPITYPHLLTAHHPAGRIMVYVLPATVTDRIVFVDLTSAGNPDNHLRAGVLWAGPLWRPAADADLAGAAVNQIEVSYVGALRRLDVVLPRITAAEKVQLESIFRSAGTTGRLLFIPRDSDAAALHHEAVYGTFRRGAEPEFERLPTQVEAYAVSFGAVEVLD